MNFSKDTLQKGIVKSDEITIFKIKNISPPHGPENNTLNVAFVHLALLRKHSFQ